MKKITFFTMMLLLTATLFTTNSFAINEKVPTSSNNPKEIPAEVKVLLNRLEEIKKMDKSNLSSTEKKELRKEVRIIKSTLKSTGNGVYLSIGAIIIIILLLILLL
jgi:predicted PurR-regulated permease PerM